mmetsp:Transcript_3871/g.11966  ORF Transcript_3871/g.11966 Transcript_3871/m.11966 type:complete len:176 (+) Transcript_3871:610-1137(+)
MPKASLRGANLTHSTFRLFDLEGVLFSPSTVLNGATFDRCDLIEPSLDGVRMDYASFLDAHFTDASFAGASFRGATFSACELLRGSGEGADFSYATLSGTDLIGVSLARALFRGTALPNSQLNECYVDGADFTGATKLETVDLLGLVGSPVGLCNRPGLSCIVGGSLLAPPSPPV